MPPLWVPQQPPALNHDLCGPYVVSAQCGGLPNADLVFSFACSHKKSCLEHCKTHTLSLRRLWRRRVWGEAPDFERQYFRFPWVHFYGKMPLFLTLLQIITPTPDPFISSGYRLSPYRHTVCDSCRIVSWTHVEEDASNVNGSNQHFFPRCWFSSQPSVLNFVWTPL